MVGQDKTKMSQLTTNSKHWVSYTGASEIQPKSEGLALMILGFVSRSFGLGQNLSKTELAEINAKRKGQDYIEKEAAYAVHGWTNKEQLTESPLVKLFEFGANNQGY